jgi:hypothetical protein
MIAAAVHAARTVLSGRFGRRNSHTLHHCLNRLMRVG